MCKEVSHEPIQQTLPLTGQAYESSWRLINRCRHFSCMKITDGFIHGGSISRRTEFKRMLEDCNARKIDIVLCKSISRFARNVVDLLEMVHHLKSIGVDVWFEKEAIWTFLPISGAPLLGARRNPLDYFIKPIAGGIPFHL